MEPVCLSASAWWSRGLLQEVLPGSRGQRSHGAAGCDPRCCWGCARPNPGRFETDSPERHVVCPQGRHGIPAITPKSPTAAHATDAITHAFRINRRPVGDLATFATTTAQARSHTSWTSASSPAVGTGPASAPAAPATNKTPTEAAYGA